MFNSEKLDHPRFKKNEHKPHHFTIVFLCQNNQLSFVLLECVDRNRSRTVFVVARRKVWIITCMIRLQQMSNVIIFWRKKYLASECMIMWACHAMQQTNIRISNKTFYNRTVICGVQKLLELAGVSMEIAVNNKCDVCINKWFRARAT